MEVIIIGIMMMVMGYILVKQSNSYIRTQGIGIWVLTTGITITITLLMA